MHARIWMTSILWGALCAYASSVVAQTKAPPQPDAQHRLVSDGGMTLYTYDPDGTGGSIRCNGVCTRLWPPYRATANAAPPDGFGVVSRSDGSLQWTYQGHPLYRYVGDTSPGAALGDGVNGTWHVARAH